MSDTTETTENVVPETNEEQPVAEVTETEASGTDEAVEEYTIEATPSEDTEPVEEEEKSRLEIAKELYKEMTDAALESSITPAERKARTAKKKAAYHTRRAQVIAKGKKKNRNRKGVTKR